jgi:hypothetical protein
MQDQKQRRFAPHPSLLTLNVLGRQWTTSSFSSHLDILRKSQRSSRFDWTSSGPDFNVWVDSALTSNKSRLFAD